MPMTKWTTEEEERFLKNRKPGFIQAQLDHNVNEFLKRVHSEWGHFFLPEPTPPAPSKGGKKNGTIPAAPPVPVVPQSVRKRLTTWFYNHSRGTSNRRVLNLNKKKTGFLHPYQAYITLYKKKVMPVINNAYVAYLETCPDDEEPMAEIKFRNEKAAAMLEAEPDNVKARVEAYRTTVKKRAKGEALSLLEDHDSDVNDGDSDDDEQSAERKEMRRGIAQLSQNIESLPFTIQSMLNGIHRLTGWVGFVIMAGPNPSLGVMSTVAAHTGKMSQTGMKMPQAMANQWATIEKSVGSFASLCFPPNKTDALMKAYKESIGGQEADASPREGKGKSKAGNGGKGKAPSKKGPAKRGKEKDTEVHSLPKPTTHRPAKSGPSSKPLTLDDEETEEDAEYDDDKEEEDEDEEEEEEEDDADTNINNEKNDVEEEPEEKEPNEVEEFANSWGEPEDSEREQWDVVERNRRLTRGTRPGKNPPKTTGSRWQSSEDATPGAKSSDAEGQRTAGKQAKGAQADVSTPAASRGTDGSSASPIVEDGEPIRARLRSRPGATADDEARGTTGTGTDSTGVASNDTVDGEGIEDPSAPDATSPDPRKASGNNILPEWMIKAKCYLDVASKDARWISAVEAWTKFESLAEGNISWFIPESKLPAKDRPLQIKQWIQNSRNTDPVITDLVQYGTKWRRWWMSMQPPARVKAGQLRKVSTTQAKWETLCKCGANGIVIALVSLSWWVEAAEAGSEDEKDAFRMVDDITWVLDRICPDGKRDDKSVKLGRSRGAGLNKGGDESTDGANSRAPAKRKRATEHAESSSRRKCSRVSPFGMHCTIHICHYENYFEAVTVLDTLDAKKGSIKSVITSVPEKNRKRTAALVIETLKYQQVLSDVIDAAQLLKQERRINSRNLALVLVHDLLLARRIQAGDGLIEQAVLRHRTRLQSELTRLKIKRGAKSNSELTQTDDAWADQRYEEGDPLTLSKVFKRDEHIPDLLAFPPSVHFTDDPLYLSGKIILQDKASCFPAHVLAPPARDDAMVIDATAAPGNKMSHLCAIMQNKGKRFGTLKTMLNKARCRNVEAVNLDFLTAMQGDPKFRGVTHILLDPSCSRSGIVNRLDHLLDNEQDEDEDSERLNKLAAFQLKMIRHAMTSDVEAVIRCSPGEGATKGFFVSLFVRTSEEGTGSSTADATKRKEREDKEESGAQPPAKRKRNKKKNKVSVS
ncbi:25S rRNA (cytosine-C(5))-methyltransferase rcm1 [Trametes pubescens]|uniref:25S rRNA (Cytosine-C(5))-methyltransferase rcm1 n=1 Tax=Trametes pubescens TaxID=154538 RepID=A0A1M2VRK6_TRAPU|nr:25S rRNA (cytosine-C(5))-methyltransferase rcm1 [Trametes pubescens]